MKINSFVITSSIVLALFASCAQIESRIEGNDPNNAECIFIPSIVEQSDNFQIDTLCSADGYSLTTIEHQSFAFTEFYQLLSPNGNIRLVASGSSEACEITGYTIDYAPDGKVNSVNYIGALEDDNYHELTDNSKRVEIIKDWLLKSSQNDRNVKYSILRDESGNINQVGAIEVPSDYKAKYFLREWGPFWSSDLDGGIICFFVLLESKETDGSYVNYLYCNNKLIAELAYWKGKFIKSRTYNRIGVMVSQSSDRDVDIFSKTFFDYCDTPKWYIDE